MPQACLPPNFLPFGTKSGYVLSIAEECDVAENRAFSFESFYHKNRRVLIWIAFFIILFLLRDFFGLIFLTYVLALIAARLVRVCQIYLHLPRRPALVLVYLLFLSGMGAFAGLVVPRVMDEATMLVKNLGRSRRRCSTSRRRCCRGIRSPTPR